MATRGKAILWIVGVFVTGSLFGGFLVVLGMRIAERRMHQPRTVERSLGSPPFAGEDGSTGRRRLEGPAGRSTKDGRTDARHRRPSRERMAFTRLMNHLDLSPDQRREIQRILAETRRRSGAADREAREHRRRLRTKMLQSIREVLNSEQQSRFDEILKNHFKR